MNHFWMNTLNVQITPRSTLRFGKLGAKQEWTSEKNIFLRNHHDIENVVEKYKVGTGYYFYLT